MNILQKNIDFVYKPGNQYKINELVILTMDHDETNNMLNQGILAKVIKMYHCQFVVETIKLINYTNSENYYPNNLNHSHMIKLLNRNHNPKKIRFYVNTQIEYGGSRKYKQSGLALKCNQLLFN